jgi:hypothetical protein
MEEECNFADVVVELGNAVDRAVSEALSTGALDHKEVADELRRIAQGWEDAA